MSIISYHVETKKLIEQLYDIDGINVSIAIRLIKYHKVKSVNDLINKSNNLKLNTV